MLDQKSELRLKELIRQILIATCIFISTKVYANVYDVVYVEELNSMFCCLRFGESAILHFFRC